jgi:hypothetical protein
VASVILSPDGDITNLAIDPPRPVPGAPFVVTGNAANGTSITAELLLPGGGGSMASAPITGGAFTLNMTAPLQDDGTPSLQASTEREGGSFGIELVRDGVTAPYNKKVLTVRLIAPNAARGWRIYE